MTEEEEAFKISEFDCKITMTIATYLFYYKFCSKSTKLVQFLLQPIWSTAVHVDMFSCVHVERYTHVR